MTAPEPPSAPVSRGAALLVALSVLAVLLAIALVLLLTVGRPGATAAGATADREQAALAVARQAVTNLLTVDPADPKGSVQRLASGATGQFRAQLDEMADGFAQSLRENRAASTGQVNEAGVRAASPEQASVLVAATAVVRNTKVPQGETVPYRLVVGLQWKDASWLVSSMEFAP